MDALKPDFLVLKLLTEWYGVIPLCFIVGLFAGGSAIADDARTGAFQFYFSRPVSKEHYLVGKVLAVCGLTCLMAVGPAVILSLARAAMSPPNQIAAAGLLLGKGVALGLVVGLCLGIPVVALSSLSTSRGVVQGGWAAVFMLSWIIGRIVAGVTASPWPVLMSIPANLQVLGAFIFGEPSPDKLPWWASALVLGALLAASTALLRWRLRSVESIQVSS
jgi:ABC-2 type transport system permease protein